MFFLSFLLHKIQHSNYVTKKCFCNDDMQQTGDGKTLVNREHNKKKNLP